MERWVRPLDRKEIIFTKREGKGNNQEVRCQRKLSESLGHEIMVR